MADKEADCIYTLNANFRECGLLDNQFRLHPVSGRTSEPIVSKLAEKAVTMLENQLTKGGRNG